MDSSCSTVDADFELAAFFSRTSPASRWGWFLRAESSARGIKSWPALSGSPRLLVFCVAFPGLTVSLTRPRIRQQTPGSNGVACRGTFSRTRCGRRAEATVTQRGFLAGFPAIRIIASEMRMGSMRAGTPAHQLVLSLPKVTIPACSVLSASTTGSSS